jgi:single-stranded DNA-binding protein
VKKERDTMSINHVMVAGHIGDFGVRLSYLPSGKPELSFALILEKLGADGKTYKTLIPIQVYGQHVEDLAATLEPGDYVLIDGQLGYKSTRPDGGKERGLIVACWSVEVLQRATVPEGG